MPDDRITRISILTPSENTNALLPELVGVHQHIPLKVINKEARKPENHLNTPHALVLTHLGIEKEQVTPENYVDVKLGTASLVSTPISTAHTIVSSHPEIGSINTTTATYIFNYYLNNQDDFQQLINYISSNPVSSSTTPWNVQTYAIKVDPTTMAVSYTHLTLPTKA